MRLTHSLMTLALVAAASACGNPKRDHLERGIAYAKRQFLEANRNPLAAASLGSITEMGGNLSAYLYAAMPDKADLPPFHDGQTTEPWSIAIRALGGDTIIIEGYGETLARPIRADTVLVRPGGRP